jgi:YHS domain-containing protein
VAVENGKEIINVNGMKVYSYNGKTYTFRDKSNRCFERTLR